MNRWKAESRLRYLKSTHYPVDVTGDACVGDKVVFIETLTVGKKPVYRIVEAEIIRDSYEGYEKKTPHLFTLADINGRIFLRPAAKIYRNGLFAKIRSEEQRIAYLREKHLRGKEARARREAAS